MTDGAIRDPSQRPLKSSHTDQSSADTRTPQIRLNDSATESTPVQKPPPQPPDHITPNLIIDRELVSANASMKWRTDYDRTIESVVTFSAAITLPNYVLVQIGQSTVRGLIDTDSTLTVLSTTTLREIDPRLLHKIERGRFCNTISADGTSVPLKGVVTVTLKLAGKSIEFTIYISDSLHVPLILGMDFLSCVHGKLDISKQMMTISTVPDSIWTIRNHWICQ